MWLDDTKQLTIENYNVVRNRYFNHFSSQLEIINYGTFGSIKAPGLSDLDLCVLVDDEFLKLKKLSFPSPVEGDQYIVTHKPLIIPVSLLNKLPYYHLIDIVWEKDPEMPEPEKPDDLMLIAAINVLKKTYYLQSTLWSMKYRKVRPCRRVILALTSVARSVEWLQRFSLPVSLEELKYAEQILTFRERWINTDRKTDLIVELEDFLLRALRISIALPEKLSRHLLSLPDVFIQHKNRGMQQSPMSFIFETDTSDVCTLLNLVKSKKYITNIMLKFNRYRRLFLGDFAFAGPAGFSILALEHDVAKVHRKKLGAYTWGPCVDRDIYLATNKKLSRTLKKQFDVNLEFANALRQGGVGDANFGSIWMDDSYVGKFLKVMSKTAGKIRPLRTFHR
ncbi:MAG: hypothetical protein P1U40_08830 [Coxiellaceae bacterium]|nr:hypothetical protein [Coxiellaceae bacterium]